MALLSRRWAAPALLLASATAIAAACGGGNNTQQSSAATGSGGHATGTGGAVASTNQSSSAAGTGGSSGSTTLALPQLVHGAAYVDTAFLPQIPIVVSATGATPDSVDVTIDNGTPTPATKDTNGYVATVDVNPLTPGKHTLVAEAKIGGNVAGTVKGSITVGDGSFELTHIATDGLAYNDQIVHDTTNDVLAYTWIGIPGNVKHQLLLNHLDGAFNKLLSSDVVLNDPKDEPLSGYTAFGPTGIGVVYRTGQGSPSPPWLVKLRVVDPTGQNVLVPTVDLTQGEAAYEFQAAGADPGGFSAAWLHIPPDTDGGTPPPNELRFSRWDLASSKLVGPIVLDTDQPQPAGSMQGPQVLEPTAEMSMACNASVCLVAYVRDVYQPLVDINTPKVFVAVVDLKSGTLVATPQPLLAGTNFDPQQWGNQIVALADGSFVLVFQDSVLLPPPCPGMPNPNDTCCDPSALVGEEFFTLRFDPTGKAMGTPKAIFAHEGYREYPRIAPVPEGFALFWEDQRSECPVTGGHIRMAANTVAPDLSKLLDPYAELPGSIALPPEYPTLAPTGTSFVVGWSDNRHGNGLTDIQDELYLDTYWHK